MTFWLSYNKYNRGWDSVFGEGQTTKAKIKATLARPRTNIITWLAIVKVGIYHEESGFEQARIEDFTRLSRLSQHLAHVTDPEMTRCVENVADVTEHLVYLDLQSSRRQQAPK